MYASAKSKADAMGTKHVARDLSEEQIYRQGAVRGKDARYGDPV